ncbi:MAG: endonuclease NucS [Candidatus Woesearchaeota archaeon]|nr:endonuclease NucS [Candidatus Woesearchaeota archaeon]
MNLEVVEQALQANKTLVAFVSCTVSYSGRAETFLEEGDRLIIIKADNTVIIHQPEGNNPVNYMKPGSSVSVEQTDEGVIIHVLHEKEKAWLDITISKIHNMMSEKLVDGQKMELAGNEKDMSDYIRDNPTVIAADFTPYSREEHTDVGFIDVFGKDKNGAVVIECKRVTASLSAVDQLRRYVERVAAIKGTANITGIVAAPAITPNAAKMLASYNLTFVSVEPPKRLERWKKHQKSLGEF